MIIRPLTGFCIFIILGLAQVFGAEIVSGPGLGAVSMSEAKLWVQVSEKAEVQIKYWKQNENPETAQLTEAQFPLKRNEYVASFNLTGLNAGTDYSYEVLVNGEFKPIYFRSEFNEGNEISLNFSTPKNWRFRQNGHKVFDFTFAMGSCAYINQPEGGYDRMNGMPYGADYQIFETIYDLDPDFFLWLGDNVYYRQPDWTSRSGMIQRWSHDRSTPEIRPLIASTPNFAIWDDHDYGPNDIGREFWLKGLATEVFRMFNPNPSAGLPETLGIFTFFNWGDLNFYLLDNRTYRTHQNLVNNNSNQAKTLLGKAQIDWLIDSIVHANSQKSSSYPISFHIIVIGNQVFSTHGKSSYHNFPKEFDYLINRLVENDVENVIFLSGDVHYGEMAKYEHETESKTYTFYEITSSPLTAGAWGGSNKNPYRIDIVEGEGDRIGQRNFVTLSIKGELGKRFIEVRYYDSNGNLLNGIRENSSETTPESIIHQVPMTKKQRGTTQ